MFGYSKDFPTRRIGKTSIDGINDDEYEEEYDALNDETFGGDVPDGDWEEGQDMLTELDSFDHTSEPVELLTTDYNRDRHIRYWDGKHEKEIAHSLSQLMLDDEETDDPAIMAISKSKTLPSGRLMNSISPPTAAIVESDHVGSPSTNSIWSASSTPRAEQIKIQGREVYLASFLNSLKTPTTPPIMDPRDDDPSFVSLMKDFRLLTSREPTPMPHSSPLPYPNLVNAKTVEEIERDMMQSQPPGEKKHLSMSVLFGELEREILLTAGVKTVSEIERETVHSPMPSSSPPLINQLQRIIRPPPGLPCNGASIVHRPQVPPYVLHPVMQHPAVRSPLTIRGPRPVDTNMGVGRSSSPIQLLASRSPPIPLLLSTSPSSSTSNRSPPTFRVATPASPLWLRYPYPDNRMIPPQLNLHQRGHPYPACASPSARHSAGKNQSQSQPYMFPQLRFPLNTFRFATPPHPSIIGGSGGGGGGGAGPGGFLDPHMMRRFTHSGQPLMQQQKHQQQQQQQGHHGVQMQLKRNSWSEPSSRGPPQFPHPLHYNNNNRNNHNFNISNNNNNNSNNSSNNNNANNVSRREDFRRGDNEDEYANLMTQSEKDWIVKIQLMQLQTDNPYMDDFYYMTYMLKKKTKELDKDVESTLVIPERSKTESRIYQPTQFEGSLGRLQVLSVNCPRKIIDLGQQHVDGGDVETQKATHRELKKFRQLLLDIEKLYADFLDIDDIDKKAAALPEEARTTLFTKKSQIISKIHAGLVSAGQDRFAQLMAIRKGRHLVLRVLPRLSKDQIDAIVILVLSNLAIILKKDQRDPVMPKLWSHVCGSLNEADFQTIVGIGVKTLGQNTELTASTYLAPNRIHLNAFVSHEIGLRIFDDLLRRANQLLIDNNDDQITDAQLKQTWSKIVEHLADAIVGLPDTSLLKSTDHLSNLVDCMRRVSSDEAKLNLLIEKLIK